MKSSAYIICLIAGLSAVSCTETPDVREFQVPEIVNIISIPEINTAVLISDLKEIPDGKFETGFYLGSDKSNLQRTNAVLEGRRFSMEVLNLRENTTYYFKAYVTNGINEIASGLESFITGSKPVIPDEPEEPAPDKPDEPEIPDEPENPEVPENPETPEVPAPENPDEPETPNEPENPGIPEDPDTPEVPDEPENPDEDEPDEPIEFSVNIIETSANYNDDILELTALLSGEIQLIKDCWFMVGTDPEHLSKIKGSIEENVIKAYLMGLDEGLYFYKAVITDGVETNESDICQITISPN